MRMTLKRKATFEYNMAKLFYHAHVMFMATTEKEESRKKHQEHMKYYQTKVMIIADLLGIEYDLSYESLTDKEREKVNNIVKSFKD